MSGTALTLVAPAKLNLFLHITGRRADGNHELQTVFQLLDWGDTLEFTPDTSGEVRLRGDDLGLAPADNLIARAAQMLPAAGRGASIRITKRIPVGGGLGGGSSDAASTLLALNQLWDCGLGSRDLQSLGAALGADVPVFVAGHSAWAEGTGERLQAVNLPPRWYLVIHPGCHVSTGQIFSARQLTRNSPPITMATFFRGGTRNDCQAVVTELYPEVAKALNWLGKFGESRLTGTGACVFAGFAEKAEAETILADVPAPWQGFVARGIDSSPTLAALN